LKEKTLPKGSDLFIVDNSDTDWITITANDQGNSGAGGAMSDKKTVTLRIGNYGVLGL